MNSIIQDLISQDPQSRTRGTSRQTRILGDEDHRILADVCQKVQICMDKDKYVQSHVASSQSELGYSAPGRFIGGSLLIQRPPIFAEMENKVSQTCFYGILPDIFQAWISFDSKLFLWSLIVPNAHSPVDFTDNITDVASLKLPKSFGDEFSDAIVVSTLSQISILFLNPVNNFLSGRFNFVHRDYSIALDDIIVKKIVTSKSGRVFLYTHDSAVYEFAFTRNDGWFQPKARKIRRTGSAVLDMMPSTIKKWVGASTSSLDICVDDSRGLLYHISQEGLIEAYCIASKDQDTFTHIASCRIDMRQLESFSTQDSEKLMKIFPITSVESDNEVLVVVTNFGRRIYVQMSQSDNPLSQRSMSITTSQPPKELDMVLRTTFYSRGVFFACPIASNPQERFRLLVHHRKLLPYSADQRSGNYSGEFLYQREHQDCPMEIAEIDTQKLLSHFSPSLEPFWSDILGETGRNEYSQYYLPRREFVVLSRTGIYRFVKNQPVEELFYNLQQLETGEGMPFGEVGAGYLEGICTDVNKRQCALVTGPVLNRALGYLCPLRSVPDHVQKRARAECSSFLSQLLKEDPQGALDAVNTFCARLLRPIWKKKLLRVVQDRDAVVWNIPSEVFDQVALPLQHLSSFLQKDGTQLPQDLRALSQDKDTWNRIVRHPQLTHVYFFVVRVIEACHLLSRLTKIINLTSSQFRFKPENFECAFHDVVHHIDRQNLLHQLVYMMLNDRATQSQRFREFCDIAPSFFNHYDLQEHFGRIKMKSRDYAEAYEFLKEVCHTQMFPYEEFVREFRLAKLPHLAFFLVFDRLHRMDVNASRSNPFASHEMESQLRIAELIQILAECLCDFFIIPEDGGPRLYRVKSNDFAKVIDRINKSPKQDVGHRIVDILYPDVDGRFLDPEAHYVMMQSDLKAISKYFRDRFEDCLNRRESESYYKPLCRWASYLVDYYAFNNKYYDAAMVHKKISDKLSRSPPPGDEIPLKLICHHLQRASHYISSHDRVDGEKDRINKSLQLVTIQLEIYHQIQAITGNLHNPRLVLLSKKALPIAELMQYSQELMMHEQFIQLAYQDRKDTEITSYWPVFVQEELRRSRDLEDLIATVLRIAHYLGPNWKNIPIEGLVELLEQQNIQRQAGHAPRKIYQEIVKHHTPAYPRMLEMYHNIYGRQQEQAHKRCFAAAFATIFEDYVDDTIHMPPTVDRKAKLNHIKQMLLNYSTTRDGFRDVLAQPFLQQQVSSLRERIDAAIRL